VFWNSTGAVGFQIAGSGFLGTTIKNREEK